MPIIEIDTVITLAGRETRPELRNINNLNIMNDYYHVLMEFSYKFRQIHGDLPTMHEAALKLSKQIEKNPKHPLREEVDDLVPYLTTKRF